MVDVIIMEELQSVLNGSKHMKAAGPDKVNTEFWKYEGQLHITAANKSVLVHKIL